MTQQMARELHINNGTSPVISCMHQFGGLLGTRTRVQLGRPDRRLSSAANPLVWQN